ncbi:MAG: hypothetical protein PHX43_05730 [Alphaproteobacteria bacterium]|nr:hypothetical protein [Alphaproteobacteria bacterium]
MKSSFSLMSVSIVALIIGYAGAACAGTVSPAEAKDRARRMANPNSSIRYPAPARTQEKDSAEAKQSARLLTGTALEIGGQFSRYTYTEPEFDPGLDITIRGLKYGITGSGSVAIHEKWYMKLEGRFAYGNSDYEGSGKKNEEEDNIGEARLLGGRDIILASGYGISPYTGVGFRYLYNDGRGLTSTGASGYRRESKYFYAPIGVTQRLLIDDSSKISLNFEYDQLIWGNQTSYMGDASALYDTIDNHQTSGYGLRGDLMYEMTPWSAGPFFNYWNINESKSSCGGILCGVEPHNNTVEYGLQFKYRID